MYRILVVDDDDALRYWLKETLGQYGFTFLEASGGTEAISIMKNRDVDLVLLDLVMPGSGGMETLLELKKIKVEVPVVMITGQGDISTAVQATKMGAYDFITKPLQTSKLIQTIQGGLEQFELRKSKWQLQASLKWIFGTGAAMEQVIEQISRVAWDDGPVVIQGEDGTGKSLAARVVHNLSKRSHLPFQSASLSAIPEALIEAELFGAGGGEPGDPTGTGKGIIEYTRGGTVYIDGLKYIPVSLQGKLLQTVEQQSALAADGSMPAQAGVRFIIGTDMDLKGLVREKKLKEGVKRALNKCVMTLPPLRDHMEDIPFLAGKFLWKASIGFGRAFHEMDRDSMDLLMRHPWRGNARELENVIRRAALDSEDGSIGAEQLKSILEASSENGLMLSLSPRRRKIRIDMAMEEGTGPTPVLSTGSEDCYRKIVEASSNGIIICVDERIEYANPAFVRITGAKDTDELEGMHGLDLFHPRYRNGLKEKIDTLLVGGQKTVPMEQRIIRFDGSAVDVETIAFSYRLAGKEAVMIILEDLTERKEFEKALRRKEKDLEEKTSELKDANAALKVLVTQGNEGKEAAENAVLANIKELVLPYLERIRRGHLNESQTVHMDMIESSLNDIISPFLEKMKGAYSLFTPTEIQVADMIRSGKTSKEIAGLLNVCSGTVEGHRISIRRKLGLNNKKANLQSYLASM